ncbi:hypothetical protein GOP47_0010910 [Adiantum capillus-veneris]|uniref:Uncharacterized protein n=1 Tax=Adiantum capillus-veneris TaxID=13818 RepID=A0A9D4ZGU7_ADICA|nr:hypothetical protein GOP47_0010910 [Adiantum capillus-veneris]
MMLVFHLTANRKHLLIRSTFTLARNHKHRELHVEGSVVNYVQLRFASTGSCNHRKLHFKRSLSFASTGNCNRRRLHQLRALRTEAPTSSKLIRNDNKLFD